MNLKNKILVLLPILPLLGTRPPPPAGPLTLTPQLHPTLCQTYGITQGTVYLFPTSDGERLHYLSLNLTQLW
jgi:hypothetical protein